MTHFAGKGSEGPVLCCRHHLAACSLRLCRARMAIGVGCHHRFLPENAVRASTSSSIVTTLDKAWPWPCWMTCLPGWYKINYDGKTGYVSADYLIIDQDNIFTSYGRVNRRRERPVRRLHRQRVLATVDAGTIVTVNGL